MQGTKLLLTKGAHRAAWIDTRGVKGFGGIEIAKSSDVPLVHQVELCGQARLAGGSHESGCGELTGQRLGSEACKQGVSLRRVI